MPTPSEARNAASLASAEIRAPFAGTITELDLKVGELLRWQAAVTIADLSRWIVKTTDLTEIDVVDIETGSRSPSPWMRFLGDRSSGSVLSY